MGLVILVNGPSIIYPIYVDELDKSRNIIWAKVHIKKSSLRKVCGPQPICCGPQHSAAERQNRDLFPYSVDIIPTFHTINFCTFSLAVQEDMEEFRENKACNNYAFNCINYWISQKIPVHGYIKAPSLQTTPPLF
jgi:hypothetical protein